MKKRMLLQRVYRRGGWRYHLKPYQGQIALCGSTPFIRKWHAAVWHESLIMPPMWLKKREHGGRQLRACEDCRRVKLFIR